MMSTEIETETWVTIVDKIRISRARVTGMIWEDRDRDKGVYPRAGVKIKIDEEEEEEITNHNTDKMNTIS